MLISENRLDAVAQAVQAALLAKGSFYDSSIRFLFVQGFINHLAGLPQVNAPATQLDLDLTNFNSVERLADGTAPLEIFLRNAAKFLKLQTESAVLQDVLDEVTKRLSCAPPVQDATAPDLPVGSLPEGLEKTIHRDDTLPFRFVAGAERVGTSVAKLRVPEIETAQIRLKHGEPIIHLGTGWLIKNDLLVTNWHVVNAREDNQPKAAQADFELQAVALKAEFDYDADDRQGHIASAEKVEIADSTLDYAVIRLKQPVGGRLPLVLFERRIDVESENDYLAVNIIQHPGGRPKRVAIRNNLIYRAAYPFVSYFTDTEGGSSGSPVCNDDWQVVALHRAWKSVQGVQFQGKTTPYVNEGTQIAAILQHLQQNNQNLLNEILDGNC